MLSWNRDPGSWEQRVQGYRLAESEAGSLEGEDKVCWLGSRICSPGFRPCSGLTQTSHKGCKTLSTGEGSRALQASVSRNGVRGKDGDLVGSRQPCQAACPRSSFLSFLLLAARGHPGLNVGH